MLTVVIDTGYIGRYNPYKHHGIDLWSPYIKRKDNNISQQKTMQSGIRFFGNYIILTTLDMCDINTNIEKI